MASERARGLRAAAKELPASPWGVLRTVGGLQLRASNAAHIVALQAAAEAAASVPPGLVDELPGEAALRAWLATAVRERELPPSGLHCATIVVAEGSFRVLGGTLEDDPWVLEQLLRVALHDPELPDRFRSGAATIALAALALSEAVAERGGVRRNTGVESPLGEPVDTGGYAELATAVSFSDGELEEICGTEGAAALAALTLAAGTVNSADRHESSPLWAKPIVARGNERVVAAPGALAAAARHAVIRLAFEHGCAEDVAETFHLAVTDSARRMLGLMGIAGNQAAPPDDAPEFDRAEIVMRFDRDKACHLLVVRDDLSDYDVDLPTASWEAAPSREALERRLRAVTAALYTVEDAPNEVLHMVVVQSFGRPYELTVDLPSREAWAPRVVLSAAELEVVARIDRLDSTLAWEFSLAVTKLRQRVPLAPYSQLEEWAMWRAFNRSFGPLEAAENPPAPIAVIGAGAELRAEQAEKEDPRGLCGPDGNWLPVVGYLADPAIPIAVADEPPLPPLAFVVDGLALPLWIVPRKRPESVAAINEHRLYAELLAYWLWRVGPSTEDLWARLAAAVPAAVIALSFDEKGGPRWDVSRAGIAEVALTLHAGRDQAFAQPTNAGERDLVAAVLDALGGIDDVSYTDVVAQVMVPPETRKLLIGHGPDPALVPTGAPYRLISESEVMDLRAAAGREVARKFGLGSGLVPPELASKVLNDVVAGLYDELERVVATLSPDGLLDSLVSFNEELVHRESALKLDRGLGMSVWGPSSPIVARTALAAAEAVRTSIASRFVIEYVATRPSRGLRPISFTVYDRLIALAALIADLGTASDLLREGLAEIVVGLAPAGHLAYTRGAFEEGATAFVEARLEVEPLEAVEWLKDAIATVDAVDEEMTASPFAELDNAWKAETGFTFADCIGVLATIAGAGEANFSAAAEAPLDNLCLEVAKALELDPRDVNAIVELFAMRVRDDFLQPPAPFEPRDVWPWRFNRRLSYLRRPLVIRKTDVGEAVVFGPRQIFIAIDYLRDLLLHGRVEAQSAELREQMSAMQQVESLAFNDAVAKLYADAGFETRVRFEKAGGRKLRDADGNHLGDIDVLVIDDARRELVCVEVKDLASALAPHQLANELRETFGTGGKRRSHAEKHVRREDWIKDNLAAVLAEVGADTTGNWTTSGVIVTSGEVLTPLVAHTPLPVRSYRRVQAALAAGALF